MIITEIGGYTVKMLDSNVWVFSKIIKNCKELISYYEANEDWVPWYTFGAMVSDSGPGMEDVLEFPTQEAWDRDMLAKYKNDHDRYISQVFFDTTKLYTESLGIKLPNWATPNWGIAKYFPDNVNMGDITMNFHADDQPERADQPGLRAKVTAIMYLNEEYTGGEISYKIVKPGTISEIETTFAYKPEEGDVVVFPSGHPYYHGVANVHGAPKYMIRTYWKYKHEGTPEWHALREKYGSEWEELEKIRCKAVIVEEPVLHSAVSIVDYYDIIERGETFDRFKSN
jgi:signal peptidase I